eukprot:TRINITY_DN1042_c0_g1_i1.p1 TRINITY_DN1042_c0_g1~~TRINITY_DN1042_c0_g1_i1.p1  ORF type:complete len:736 (+),score=108.86 TRINITY_DN1042_c0_g1_i1:59-2209(+)
MPSVGNGATYLERFGLTDNTVMALSPKLQGIDIVSEDVIDIGKGLVENWSLTSLELGRCNVTEAGTFALAEALSANHTLRYLGLAHNTVGDSGCRALCEALSLNQSLEILDLSSCGIGDYGTLAIAQMLELQMEATPTKKCGEIRSLILENNRIGTPGAAALSAAITQTRKLKSLNLYGNRLREAGCAAFTEGLRRNASLTYLNIGNNDINPEGGEILFDGLHHNTTITALHLQKNRLGSSVVKLADLCNVNLQLRDVNLECCCITSDTAKQFGEKLISPSFLMINFGLNTLGDDGVTALCQGLRGKIIRYVDLTQVGMTSVSLQSVCDLIRIAPCLQTVQLDGNNLGPTGAEMLAEVMKINTTVDSLNLGETNIGPSGATLLVQSLANNLLIRNLDLSGNSITNDAAVAICSVLAPMCRLAEFDLSANDISSSPAVLKALCSLFPNNRMLVQINLSGCPVGDLYDGGLFTRHIATTSCGMSGLPEISASCKGRKGKQDIERDLIRGKSSKPEARDSTMFRPAWAPALPPARVYGDELQQTVEDEDEDCAEGNGHPPLVVSQGSLLHPLYPGYGRGRASNEVHCDTLNENTTLPMFQSGCNQSDVTIANSSSCLFQMPPKRHKRRSPYSLSSIEGNIGGLPITDEALRRKFQELDADGSGYLDFDEFKVIFSNFQNFGLYQSNNELDGILKKYKVMDDGKVSFDEFALIMLSLARR